MPTSLVLNDTKDLSDLNVYLALHDEVVIPGWTDLERFIGMHSPAVFSPSRGIELFLEYSERGLVKAPEFLTGTHAKELGFFMTEARSGRTAPFPDWVDEAGRQYLGFYGKTASHGEALAGRDKSKVASRIRATFTNATVLFFTHYLSEIHPRSFIPTLKLGGDFAFSDEGRLSDSSGLRILLGDLLLPTQDTPVEAVLDFRNDPVVREHLLAFRSFARRLDKFGYSEIDIADEYELKRYQYNRYIESNRLDFKRQKIDLLLSYPQKIILDLLKLDFGGAVGKFMKLRRSSSYKAPSLKVGDPGYELAIIADFETWFSEK